MSDAFKKIASVQWENRVQRTGFLQSKGICNEAEVLAFRLTPRIVIKYDNVFWVQDYNLYDDLATKSFPASFEKAFAQDKSWPIKLLKELDTTGKEVKTYTRLLARIAWDKKSKQEKIKVFETYAHLLKKVQKYYVIAVPLTNYCESQLQMYPDILAHHAVAYKKLEIDNFYTSKNPLKEFAWVKTAYNIIEKLQLDETSKETAPSKNAATKKRSFGPATYLVTSLQAAIYIRNRIKELAQQLWYYIEPLCQNMARDIGVGRDAFFMLTHTEALESFKKGKAIVSDKEVINRKSCFAIGIVHGKEIIVSGEQAKKLVSHYATTATKKEKSNIAKGSTSYPGRIIGTARIILVKNEFSKLHTGDILVTSMTTPDFVVLMKKAAAIVTDEGGLSCHAAIVSREMKVPCIIGTRNATKILKDGDKVLVDATKGTVEKI